MGGTGSGRWDYYIKKRTVEECWTISVSDVTRAISLHNPDPAPRFIQPTNPSKGTGMPSVRCSLEMGEDDERLLKLIYTADGRWDLKHRVEQIVPLQVTHPNFGGVRWWFSCPRLVDGKECGRRVGKLYRPPDGRYFACRHCVDLTYESCQTSHRYDGLFALMAGEASGEAFETVKRVFAYQRKEAKGSILNKPAGRSRKGLQRRRPSTVISFPPFSETRRTRRHARILA